MDKPTIHVFEELADRYDAWFDRHPWAYEAEIRACQEFLAPHVRGLEIGVGTGRFAGPLGIAVGVEPAAAMAAMAHRRGIKVYRAVAEALPFRRHSFDLVVMVTVICFLRDPFLALTEATRVLQPGGQILLGMIDKDSPLGQSYEAHKQESDFYRQARFYAVSQAVGWLEQLAYGQVETCQTIYHELPGLTGREPVRRGHGQGAFVVIAARKSAS
jgi:SAM-dependent methyltransferase